MPSPVAYADIALICALDEQWSFVRSKARQHRIWYGDNTKLAAFWLIPVQLIGGITGMVIFQGNPHPAISAPSVAPLFK
ncbi:hypothetical protein HW114_00255 [Serratia symbiotica]|uniref:Uncharacterized protein n=1 Tax=Serratia symbiotica TaxID=138074 RepID=A0A7D5SH51_9GAMM|nr:hypothetical protein [Serratia symbiotica]MBQ0956642.1 hypothetical protein [Serratia symbiotica]QLH64292.1 hypothetical protein SYMBAF_05835 [Serratia symbiotica]QTP15884.1 hypothetical protein GPZ83_0007625 [Serratia symbiotica]